MADFEFEITESAALVDLEEYLNYLIIERCNEIYDKIISQNSEYQDLQARIEDCFQELLRVLPEPVPKAIVTENLAGMVGTLEMLLPRLIYRQVLKDGLEVKEWLGR